MKRLLNIVDWNLIARQDHVELGQMINRKNGTGEY